MPGHFVNEVNSCVDDSLVGYVRTYSHLELAGRSVISRAPITPVAVISGCGSGHEPAMVGFVGRGLLNACIQGSIFASPPSSDIFRLIVEMKRRGAKQILMIINNYTGDRLNFGLAMERARELSIDIDMLVVADDAAVENAIGPRGLAGSLLVIKVAGALAEQGKNMSEIVDVCQQVRGQLRTIGLSASGIRVPGQQQSFELMDDEMELGMGLHGESGAQKLKLLPCRQTVDLAIGQLTVNSRTLDLQPASNILLFVNNLGGCSNLEVGIITKDAIENLERRKFHVKRVICGEMMTSFNMKGFSLTILKLASDKSSNVLDLLDAPTDAFAWPKLISPTPAANSIQALSDSLEFNEQFSAQLVINESQLFLTAPVSKLVQQALQTIVKRIHSETDNLNRLDAVSGDGDTGIAFSRAADAIARDLANGKLALDRPSSLFRRLGLIAESRMGGTCGAICGLFFAATAKQLSLSTRKGKPIERLSDAIEAGIQSVESYARVQPGDKSLLDALIPAVDFIKTKHRQENFTAEDWKDLAIIVEQAAEDTKNLIPKVGRAAYIKAIDTYVADPGAYAVAIIFQAICDTFIKAATH
jgi:dihydroxyacetone kinase